MLQAADVRAQHPQHTLRGSGGKPWSEDNPPQLRPGKPLVERRSRRAKPVKKTPPREGNSKP